MVPEKKLKTTAISTNSPSFPKIISIEQLFAESTKLNKEKNHELFSKKFTWLITESEKFQFSFEQITRFIGNLAYGYLPSDFSRPNEAVKDLERTIQSFLEKHILDISNNIPNNTPSDIFAQFLFYLVRFIQVKAIKVISEDTRIKLEFLFSQFEVTNENKYFLLTAIYMFGLMLDGKLIVTFHELTAKKIGAVVSKFSNENIEPFYINHICVATSAVANNLNYSFGENTVEAVSTMLKAALAQEITHPQLAKVMFCFGSLIQQQIDLRNKLHKKVKLDNETLINLRKKIKDFSQDQRTEAIHIGSIIKGINALIKTRKLKGDISVEITNALRSAINGFFEKNGCQSDNFPEYLLDILKNLQYLLKTFRNLGDVSFNVKRFYLKTIFYLQRRKSTAAYDCWIELGKLMQDDYLLPNEDITNQFLTALDSVTLHKRMNMLRVEKLLPIIRLLVEKNFTHALTNQIQKFIHDKVFEMLNKPSPDEMVLKQRYQEVANLLVVLSTHAPVDKNRATFADSLIYDISQHPKGGMLALLISQKLCKFYQLHIQPIQRVKEYSPVHLASISPYAFSAMPQTATSENNNNNNNAATIGDIGTDQFPIPSSYQQQNIYKRKKSSNSSENEHSDDDYEKRSSKYRTVSRSPSVESD